jgi:hypothetical protein
MANSEQVPSVSRIVHYVSYGTPGGEYPSVCRAAVITATHNEDTLIRDHHPHDTVHLCVLNPEGQFFNRLVPYDEGKRGGTWHWPERV